MITDKDLRQALHRAAATVDTDVHEAEERVRGAATRARSRRVPILVAAAAALVIGLAVTPGLLEHRRDEPGPASSALPASGSVPAGTYRFSSGYPDPVAVSLPDGWSVAVKAPGDLRLVPPGASGATIGVVTPERVFAPDGRSTPAPRDLTTWLKTRPTLTVTAAEGVPVGALYGTRLRTRPTADTPLFDAPAGPITVADGDRMVAISVNDAGRFVVVFVIAPPAELAAASAAFDALVAGMQIPG